MMKVILHNPELWGSEHLAIYDFTDDGEQVGIVGLERVNY